MVFSILKRLRYVVRLANWIWPHIQAWQRERNRNRTEGERNLKAGNYAEAERYLRRAIRETDGKATARAKRLRLTFDLVEAQLGQKNYADAKATANALVSQLVASKQQASANGARAWDLIGSCYLGEQNFPEAQRALAEALSMQEKLSPANAKDLAFRCHRLGQAYLDSGDTAQAKPFLERALALQEGLSGTAQAETGSRRYDLGKAQQAVGNHAEALDHFQKALAIHEKTLRPEDPAITSDLTGMAASYIELNDYEHATECYERALRLMERQIGVNRTDLARLFFDLARVYARMGRSSRSQELLQQCVPLFERTSEKDYASALDLLGLVFYQSGRYAEAEPLLERAGAVWSKDEEGHRLELMANLKMRAAVLESLKKMDQATALRLRLAGLDEKAIAAAHSSA